MARVVAFINPRLSTSNVGDVFIEDGVKRLLCYDPDASFDIDPRQPILSTDIDRINEAGYDGYPRAENIAAGAPDAESVMAGWMGSDGHCLNIMDPSLTELGVGFVDEGEYGYYWVQTFGSR